MSNTNQLLYFVSQSFRQVQLSVDKSTRPYSHSEFLGQFAKLLEASGDEAYARHLTIELVEEATQYGQTTDYLRQELAFETQPLTLGDRTTALELDKANHGLDIYNRRLNRQASHAGQLVGDLV